MPTETRLSRSEWLTAHGFMRTLAIPVLVFPLTALLGWWTGILALAGFGRDVIPMAPSTAICFLLLSIFLIIAPRSAHGLLATGEAGLVGGAVALYGLLVAIAQFTGLPVNPDNLFFRDVGILGTHPLGRMSPATGILFTLSGISLCAVALVPRRTNTRKLWWTCAIALASVIMLAGAVFSLSYTIDTPLLYTSTIIPIALPTALSFLFLGGALAAVALFCDPSSGQWHQRLSDVRISTRLWSGLGCVLVFVILMGLFASRQTDRLWDEIDTIHNHVFLVSMAVGELRADVLTIRSRMRDLFIAGDERDIALILQDIEEHRTDALRQFDALKERYLGPLTDITSCRNEFQKWFALHQDTIRLVQQNKRTQANARIKSRTIGAEASEVLLDDLAGVVRSSRSRGNAVFRRAALLEAELDWKLAVVVALISALSFFIVVHLMHAIKLPLTQLAEAAEQFRLGRTDVRCLYVSQNEFGVLSREFNAMADTLESNMRITEQSGHIAEIMLKEDEIHAFCRGLLTTLIEQTGSQLGAVYLLNPQQTHFELVESIGLGNGACPSFSVSRPEGEFGAALATGRMMRIKDIPEDSPFTFSAVSGQFKPREILTLPLLDGQKRVAVISLASLRGFDASAIRLLEEIRRIMTARIKGVLTFRRIQELAARLEWQNRELDEQRRERTAQADELVRQNLELEAQGKRLDEANRLKSIFLSNMSHELRTPLNSVIALSAVLHRRLSGKIPQEESGYLKVIERSGKHLLSLINDILDLSRIEAGREQIEAVPFSLGEVIAEIAVILEPQAREKDVALVIRVPPDLPLITSDCAKVRHILQNLVDNAVKFTESGSVEISAAQAGQKLQVTVRDTGIGMTADQVPHIFEEFRQIDDSISRKFGGSGLGLAIAKKYATILGGDIAVASAPRQGSTFTLTLPLDLEGTWKSGSIPVEQPIMTSALGQEPSAPSSVQTPPGGMERTRKTRPGKPVVLVVEDNPDNLITLRAMLKETCIILEAWNSSLGLEQARRHLPDLILLDIGLPGMDGFAVMDALRSDAGTRKIPVVAVTARAMNGDREEILGYGFDAYLAKPVDEGTLLKTVHETLYG